ncbi:uncharacterized protein Z520_11365 [Fonsecaea multimorphosa CBS 102226]|uniref:Uncharacterized protein n=1 Tax=Fonsecaea multimorphosa CBS 102226 TaxID=1442371 RepID=A0A0D2JR02_9EURO|nr:uncharacterized protein Z520_11365 [Fonsecaea multimorphosa CBS 102226]KIX92889.1 hypothetical protein Z520_11365 [Fonsecaea multimorphosa CBS 102226]OAL18139.1 hypothetical protein AYO22_10916 [Fonsecaea multimorphosa]
MDASNDGSESVDQFLARIASLSSKQGQEEAERSRKMEEEMLQARKERQARRAERARSLSPSKTGPTPSLRLVGESARKTTQGIDPPVALTPPPLQPRTVGRSDSISPRPERAAASGLDFTRPLPPPAASENPSTPSPSLNATALSRSGTLSWQQRPSSRGVGSRPRPLSVASIPDSALPQGPAQLKDGDDMTRKDIAASLGAKDPSWFRQTADRGVGSAAYRKNETDSETPPPFSSRGMRLPGMSKDSNAPVDRSRDDPEKATPPPSPPKSFAQPLEQEQLSKKDDPRPTRPLSMVSLSPSKPPALDLPSFKPLDLNSSFAADTPSLGRTSSILSSAGRPPSPTKGLGGFVESAMMKRSDSVSKRWSVQANAGLKRGDSVATPRPAHVSGTSGFSPGHSRGTSRDVRGVGNSSPLSSSRPVSSHGAEPVPLTKARPLSRTDDPTGPSEAENTNAQDVQAGHEASRVQHQDRPTTPPSSESLLSRSPSKTMDPRRWSPTKASWLESALNKPDSPRFTPAKPETPAWKLNMQRAKQEQQQRSSEPVDTVPAKPDVAPKPHISPPVKEPATLSEPVPQKDPSTPAADEADTAKGLEDGSLAPRDTPTSQVEQPKMEKRDEKPAVPSKRNVTPISQTKSSNTKSETAAVASIGNEQAPAEASQANTSDLKPPMLKPKPQTPPKTDFRATLKSRQAAPASNNDAEPEFKAVFGKLKRTQTQNYVAPDILKANITKGKAGLNATGGPQKTKRVDEFKESILQKKEAMKTGDGPIGKRPDAPSPLEKPAQAVPEALARRMTLHKTGPSSEKIEVKKPIDPPVKPAVSAPKPPHASAKPAPEKQNAPVRTEQTPISAQKLPVVKPEKSASVSTTVFPVKSASEIRSDDSQSKADTSPAEVVAAVETAFKTRAPENSKLAARLNPALAGIISRSGSPKPPGEASSSGTSAVQVRDTTPASRESTNDHDSELTHMTKARAKGPKRRAPKSGQSSKGTATATVQKPVVSAGISAPTFSQSSSSRQPISDTSNTVPVRLFGSKSIPSKPVSEVEDKKPVVAAEVSTLQQRSEERKPDEKAVEDSAPARPKSALEAGVNPKSKPAVANKSAELRKVSNPSMSAHVADESAPVKPGKSAELKTSSIPALLPKHVQQPSQAKPSTPKKFEILADRAQVVSPPPQFDGLRKNGPLSPPPGVNSPLTPNKFKINTPKEPKPEVDSSLKPTSLTSTRANGLGLQLASASRKPAATPELTPPPEPEAVSTKSATSFRSPASPTKSARSVKPHFESFFGVLPQARAKAEFDTHAFLTSQNKAAEKCKTLSKQVWEVSGDGKRTTMPPQQEHILFEDCMYLCVHSMESPAGSKSAEVYLWCGDEVPEAAVEDAQLFCRKVARENNAKLEVVKQGKESSEFFQALGGIVIVRKSKSAALYMLCGRRHLGHVAFDEVDLSADSLSSGLPFLISAKFGKLYLWKGNGSNPEDVGCARLIGMDMGLTGEIEEVSEGEEPLSFWEAFPSRPGKRVAPRTRNQTSQLRGHAPRLYRVEHDRPKSSGGFWGLRAASPPKQPVRALVDEIAPFNQKDLDANHIHILDTYGELYVLVGGSAKKPAEFVTAVQVAQEIAVLSPSVQDRPLLPACYVVMGDPPENIKSVFRKWKPDRSASRDEQVCVRVEEVIQELGITL